MNKYRWAGVTAGLAGALAAVFGQSLPELRLGITPLRNRQVQLSWATNFNTAVVQSAEFLGNPVLWRSTTNQPVQSGNSFLVDFDAAASQGFFRIQTDLSRALTQIEETSPSDREQGVSVNRETIFYFSGPLAEKTVIGPNQLVARLGQRRILARTELSKDRRKASLFYLEPIPAGARLTVTLDASGLLDSAGRELDADHDGRAGGTKTLQFDTYSATPLAGTSVTGHVFASERASDGHGGFTNQPLENVTITVDGAEETLRTTTDPQGAFTLARCPSGRFFVHVDGRTAKGSSWPNGAYYPVIGKAWETAPGQSNNLAGGTGEIFLPLIPEGTLQPISATQDTTVTFAPSVLAAHPELQGVQITVPANSLYSDDGKRGGRVGIAPVAADRLPEPLPPGLDHVLDITVQTDGPSNFDQPVPACFPNVADSAGRKFAPGEKTVLMSYNHDSGRWEAIGSMTVGADGRLICTDPGVGIRQPGWHGVQPMPFEPFPCPGQCCDGGAGGAPSPPGGAGGNPAPASITGGSLPQVDGRASLLDDIDIPLEPLAPDSACFCNSLAGDSKTEGECLKKDDDLFNRDIARCEEQFNACAPCVRSAACTACYAHHKRCLRAATKASRKRLGRCARARRIGCFDGAGTQEFALDRASRAALQNQQTPSEVVHAILEQIDELVLGAGPDGVTAEVQVEIEGLLASAEAASGSSVEELLDAETQTIEARLFGQGFFQNAFGNAPAYPIFYMATVSRPAGTLELRGMTGPFGEYTLFTPRDGVLQEVSFYDPKTRTYGYVYPLRIPEAGRRLPRVLLLPIDDDEPDADNDGLPDEVEEVYGTDVNNPDSDGDGLPDGVEAANGSNPLDGRPATLGLVASADTPGVAQDICVVNEMAIVADGPAGVVLFDVRNPLAPVRLAQIETTGPALAVAASASFGAVAQGAKGLGVIDLSDPTSARKLHDVQLGGPVRAVAVARGLAYAGSTSGLIGVVDLQTGIIVDQIQVNQPVHDLAVRGEVLFVALETELRTFRAGIHLKPLGAATLAFGANSLTGRRRIFVGTAFAQVADLVGFETFDIRDPAVLRLIGPAALGGQQSFRQIVDTGFGLGLAAVGATASAPQGLYLYDLSDPTSTIGFLTVLPTPGVAYAVAAYDGYALVADGEAGLEILNYRQVDTGGKPPRLTLETNLRLTSPTNAAAMAGEAIEISASVSDDVQVRRVELFLDGALAAVDGNFPFAFRFPAPQPTANRTSMALRCRAIDTGGNSVATDEIAIALSPDTRPPLLRQTMPVAGGIVASVRTVSAVFNEPMDPARVNSSTIQVHGYGPDKLLGTADDVILASGTLAYRSDLNAAEISFPADLAPGSYSVFATRPLADLHGNEISPVFSRTFFVIPGPDSDGDGVPDALERALGLDPNNRDSDGNGVPDGLEDFDKDGLPNAFELLAGLNPAKPDSNGNGTPDGDEDTDSDSLSNRQEFLLGTNPAAADSDGDGWNDEAEVTMGTDPLDYSARPVSGFAAAPPVRISVAALGDRGGHPFNTSIGVPVVKVTAAGLGVTDGLQANTTIAAPRIVLTVPGIAPLPVQVQTKRQN